MEGQVSNLVFPAKEIINRLWSQAVTKSIDTLEPAPELFACLLYSEMTGKDPSETTDVNNPECCRRSFAASVKDTAKRLLDDPTVAPRAIAKERIEICKKCDRFRSESQTCEICGCFMPLKTAAANMRCPIDKWEEWRRGN